MGNLGMIGFDPMGLRTTTPDGHQIKNMHDERPFDERTMKTNLIATIGGLLALQVMAADPDTAKQINDLRLRIDELEKHQSAGPGTPGRSLYQDGLRFVSPDGAYNVQFGGRLQWDNIFMSADDAVEERVGEAKDESGFRRALIKGMGTIHSNLDYLVMFNLANDEVLPLDAWVQLRNIPVVQRIRAGHFREPMGLDAVASSRDLSFAERAPAVLALAPFYNGGVAIMQNRFDNRLYACAGLFRETDTKARFSGEDGYHATARLTGLPWVGEDAKHFVHLGVSASYQDPSSEVTRYSSKPGAFFAPTFVDTKAISNSEQVVVLGAEAAAVFNRCHLQAEILSSDVDHDGETSSFGGWYAQAGWFLTQDTHPFDRQNALFSRVRPASPFTSGAGAGAWELVTRYSHFDLNDGTVQGGELDNTSFGVNWYLDANFRLTANYVLADLADVGNAELFVVRMQLDF